MSQKYLYVYILLCENNTYYIGVTNDVERRFEEHCEAKNPNSFTARNRPVKVVYTQKFDDFNAAIDLETRLKKWSRKKKEALISGELHLLPELSKKKNFKRKQTVIPSNNRNP